MANNGKILIEEHNIISLRTACVLDLDGFVALQLLPAESSMPTRPKVYKAEFIEWLRCYQIFMYEYYPSVSTIPIKHGRELAFEMPPELKLIWTDSGNSVAVYLNGEPWAFIDEHTQKAYSKGICASRLGSPWDSKVKVGNPWNQEAFEKTFAHT
jgi:hypothetical protein